MLRRDDAERIAREARLSARQTELWRLVVVEGCSIGDAGESMGWAPKTTYTQWRRIRQKLLGRENLQQMSEEHARWLLHEAIPNVRAASPPTPVYTEPVEVLLPGGGTTLLAERVRISGAPVVTPDDLTHPGRWRRIERSPAMAERRARSRRLHAPRDRATGGLQGALPLRWFEGKGPDGLDS